MTRNTPRKTTAAIMAETAAKTKRTHELRREGCTVAEIAAITGYKPSTVSTKLYEGGLISRDAWTRKCLRCQKTVELPRMMFMCQPCRVAA